MDKHLHIVALDVPWPGDYGGAIEQLHKIIALHKLGIKIHLHCFTKIRPHADNLLQYCATVDYYPRQTGLPGFSFTLPYIVASRNSQQLLHNLQKDHYPILFEGIHTTFHLDNSKLKNRQVLIRLHNVEYNYYHRLAAAEHNWLKKVYFRHESYLLKMYESQIAKKYPLLAISETDRQVFANELSARSVEWLPAFPAWQQVTSQPGKGCYCLYHANLSVNENERAAIWLLEHIFNNLNIPFVIAGKSPSQKLQDIAHRYSNCCIVTNPGEAEMDDMIAKAQINILPSFNTTGVKLKLLHALYTGRHCITNTAGVAGSGLEPLCSMANTAAEYLQVIRERYEEEFLEPEITRRSTILSKLYSNQKNAEQLIAQLHF